MVDPELYELSTPNSILTYEYRKDSAGVGKWRGGYGVTFSFRVEGEGILLSCQGGNIAPETAAFGLAGGGDGALGKMRIRKATSEMKEVERATMYRPSPGDVVEHDSSGGGGYGNPYERPVELVLADVIDELLSVEKAQEDYGVVINPQSLTVDQQGTRLLRKARLFSHEVNSD